MFMPPARPVDLRDWSQWWQFTKGADWGRAPCRGDRYLNEPCRVSLRGARRPNSHIEQVDRRSKWGRYQPGTRIKL